MLPITMRTIPGTLLFGICFTHSLVADAVQDIWLAAIQPFTGGAWDGGLSMRVGGEIMLEEINAHPNLLPGFNLRIVWQDGYCSADTGKQLFLENLFDQSYTAFAPGKALSELDTDGSGIVTSDETDPMAQTWTAADVTPAPVGFMLGCSGAAINVAYTAYKARVALIANSASRPVLSDRSLYPNFFRTILPDTFFNAAWIALAKLLGQSSVISVIGETENWGSMGIILAATAVEQGVEMVGYDLSSEIDGFKGIQISLDSETMADTVANNLVAFKQRFVLMLMHAYRDRLVMCAAYNKGFRNAVFTAFGWMGTGWWEAGDVACTNEQMNQQAFSMIMANMLFWRTDSSTVLGCSASMTSQQFIEEWFSRQNKDYGDLTLSEDGYYPALEGATTADAICMYASMLHEVLVNRAVPLSELSGRTEVGYNNVQDVLSNTDFEGIQGRVQFSPGEADPKGSVTMQQVQTGNVLLDVAYYNHPTMTFLGNGNLIFHFAGETFAAGPNGANAISGSLQSFKSCPSGQALNFETNVCESCSENREYVEVSAACLCVAGYYENDAGECIACPAGNFSSSAGSLSCPSCEIGRYSSGAATECTFCPLGRFADRQGMTQCTACPGLDSGLHTTEAIASSSADSCVCAIGAFVSNSATMPVTCSRCPTGSTTTDIMSSDATKCLCTDHLYMNANYSSCLTCPSGSTTTGTGKTSVVSCLCDKDEYMPEDPSAGCQACPSGMTCPKGSNAGNKQYLGQTSFGEEEIFPHLSPRYWSALDNPMSVFECESEEKCPGGLPGRACAGYLRGQACEHCEEGTHWDGSECRKCASVETTKLLFPTLPAIFCPIIFILMYRWCGDSYESWNSYKNAIATFLFVTLNHYQVIGILSTANVALPTSMSPIYEQMRVTMDVTSIFKVDCTGMSEFQTLMIVKGLAPLVIVLTFAIVLGGSRIVSRIANNPDIDMSLDRCLNVLGTILFTFFSAIAAMSLLIFKCTGNPNGKQTLVADLSVICFESDDWKSMVGAGVAFVLIYVVFMGGVFLRAVIVAPLYFGDDGFQSRYKFLFIKFRAESYWWSLVYLGKNFCLNLCMCIVVAGVQQLFLAITVAMVYMLSLISYLPYRYILANVLELIAAVSIIYAGALMTWFADRDDGGFDQGVGVSAAVLCMWPLLSAVVAAVLSFLHGQRIPYTSDQYQKMQHRFEDIKKSAEAMSALTPSAGAEMMLRLAEWDRWYLTRFERVVKSEVLGQATRSRVSDKSLSSSLNMVITETKMAAKEIVDVHRTMVV